MRQVTHTSAAAPAHARVWEPVTWVPGSGVTTRPGEIGAVQLQLGCCEGGNSPFGAPGPGTGDYRRGELAVDAQPARLLRNHFQNTQIPKSEPIVQMQETSLKIKHSLRAYYEIGTWQEQRFF